MTSAERRNLRTGLLFILPWLAGFLCFSLYPILASVYYSFCDYSVLSPPVFIGVQNYADMVGDEFLHKAVFNTFFIAALTIPLNTAMAVFLAVLLNFNVRGRGVFRTVLFLPSLVPMVCLGTIWLWLLNGELGLVNSLLRPLLNAVNDLAGTALRPPNWLEDPSFAKFGLALAGIWSIGHAMVIYLAGLQEAPSHLYEAAEIDGASFWQKLWHVTLPMLSPYLFFNMIMALIASFQIFAVPYVLTDGRNGPEHSLFFIATIIYENAFKFWNMGYACAVALILFLLILSLTLVVVRLGERKVYYAGR